MDDGVNSPVKLGDEAVITTGSNAGKTGVVVALGRHAAALLVEVLGDLMPIEVPYGGLRSLSPPETEDPGGANQPRIPIQPSGTLGATAD
jgi:ribosomal protein L24